MAHATPRRALLAQTAAFAIAAALPHSAEASNPDAELIRLADLILVEEAARQALGDQEDYDDDAVDAATNTVFDMVNRLMEMPPSRTPAGHQAKARAAWAMAERALDGTLMTSGTSEDFAWSVVAEAAGRA